MKPTPERPSTEHECAYGVSSIKHAHNTRIVACLHRVCLQLGAKPKIPYRCIQGGAMLQNIYDGLLEDVRHFAGLPEGGTDIPSPQAMSGKNWDWYAGPWDKSVLLIGYTGSDLVQRKCEGSTNTKDIVGIFSPNDPRVDKICLEVVPALCRLGHLAYG